MRALFALMRAIPLASGRSDESDDKPTPAPSADADAGTGGFDPIDTGSNAPEDSSDAGPLSVCGNGAVHAAAGKECDHGTTGIEECPCGVPTCTVCDSSCRMRQATGSYCGDGMVDPPFEVCGDGELDNLDGCMNACKDRPED